MKLFFYLLSFYIYANNYSTIEQNIICGDFEKAYDLSIETIKQFPKADWKIVDNAWLLADTLHQYSDLGLLSFELARRGVSLNY